ncbi:MAG: redoxin domain-containing protein [Anaerolineaceae bacterium]|nr:redoxin domain-containing protein [Anaerolineaceae bacterium]
MSEVTSQPPVKPNGPSPILLVFLIIPLFGIIAAVALAISEGGFGSQPVSPTPQAVSSDFVSLVGEAAPDFSLTGLDGAKHQLTDYKGRVTFVNFWATWCGPCQVELPTLERFMTQQGSDGAMVLAVNAGESADQITTYFKQNEISGLNVLLDSNIEVYTAYGINALPTTFIVDKDGVIRFRHFGMLRQEDIDGYMSKLAST